MELSIEQQYVFDKYIRGENIFITGPGGSGKSYLINVIYKHALRCGKDIYVTALTGCAAILLNCKARTLHSWAGVGLGNNTVEYYVAKIKKNKMLKKIWKSTDVLIVDEISMLSLKLFELLNIIGQEVRKNSKPFGGIQLIFSGDFYQLPPVGDKDDKDTQRFCFESEEWERTFPKWSQIELKKIFRQNDNIYADILNQIREGKLKRKSNNLLETFVGRQIDPNMVANPTKLYPTKKLVEQINITNMSQLDTDQKTYTIKYVKDLEMTKSQKEVRKNYTDKEIQLELDFLANNLLCEKEMTLKIGAQVMCVINIKSQDNGDILICNGSQGIITSFCEFTNCPKVKYNNGVEMVMTRNIWASEKIPGIGVSQIPLILSWALTIHKSQGATLECAEIDIGSGIFECGQTYVALSRVKNLNGLYLKSFDAKKIMINRKVKEFYEGLHQYHENKKIETVVPICVAEPIQTATCTGPDSFISYQYNEAQIYNANKSNTLNTDLEEEEYVNNDTNIKIIRLD